MKRNKTRIGLFMYTPMLGGAEMHFKDLVWNLNRENFEIVVFYEPWNEFVEFLNLTNAPPLKAITVKIKEIGGHFGAKELTLKEVPKQLGKLERLIIQIHKFQKALPSSFLKIPIRLARAIFQFGFFFLNLIYLYKTFKKNPCDILHVVNGGYPGAQSAQLAGLAARYAGYQHTIMSVCNSAVPYNFPKVYERLLDVIVRHSFEALLIPSDFIGNSLKEFRNFRDTQIQKIPYAVVMPDEIIREKGLSPSHQNTVTIGMAASFLPHKGQQYLLEAIALLKKNVETLPKLQVIMIGDGPTINPIHELAVKLGINDLIEFKGFLPLKEMLEVMSQLDIFTLPSEMEGMPYVILHAMSLSKPVIATPVGGIPDLIIPEKTGILVPARNSQELACALKRLLCDKSLRMQMGQEAYAYYKRNFTLSSMISRYQTLYQTIMKS